MKATLIIGGLFIIIFVVLIPLKRDIAEYDTQRNGEFITATIAYVPNCIGTKVKHFMKFNYAGKLFDKKVSCGFGDMHKVGETIKLKHTQGTDIFLFENENKEIEFVSVTLLTLIGLFLMVYGLLKKRNSNDSSLSNSRFK